MITERELNEKRQLLLHDMVQLESYPDLQWWLRRTAWRWEQFPEEAKFYKGISSPPQPDSEEQGKRE